MIAPHLDILTSEKAHRYIIKGHEEMTYPGKFHFFNITLFCIEIHCNFAKCNKDVV